MSSSINPEAFAVALDAGQTVTALHYAAGQPASGAALIVAHGAGAGQTSPFMVDFARALATRGFDTVTFNFLYTEQRRRLPDRAPVLEACYAAVIEETRRRLQSARDALFIGGKSMGGRMATHLGAQDVAGLKGIVVLGYPLHPPGQPDKLRVAHLSAIHVPVLIVQGEKDTFGAPDEFKPHLKTMTAPVLLHAIAGADHSLTVRSKKGADVFDGILTFVADWIRAG